MWQWLQWRQPVDEVVRHYNQQPQPAASTPLAHCRFVVIDLETTGLNARKDHIVSLGWVVIEQQQIRLSDSGHLLVRLPVSVGQSAVFHGLHDRDLSQALELPDALRQLLQLAAGAVLVAHHARLEQSFLSEACRRCFGKSPRFRFLDTMKLEWRRSQLQGKVLTSEGLRLPHCLSRHHLPVSQHHHAQEDAFSAALLLLSQMKQTRSAHSTLGDLWQLAAG